MSTMASAAPAVPAAGRSRREFGWASYEAAKAPTFTLIFMFIFAPYFAQNVASDPVRGQEMWAIANTIAGASIALVAPFLGAAADRMGRRKPWLFVTVLLQALACTLLWFAVPGGTGVIGLPVIFLLIVSIGMTFELGTLMHNSLLASVAGRDRAGPVSGLGAALGNVASFTTMVSMFLLVALPAAQSFDWAFLPETPILGLDPAQHEHSRIAGPFAGMWLLLFSLPFFLWTPDVKSTGIPLRQAMSEGLSQLARTIREARKVANVGRFLLARMIYNDAIVAMQAYCAIYAAGVFGWDAAAILIFAMLITGCCFLGSLFGGWIDMRIGSMRAILLFNAALAAALIASISIGPDQLFFIRYDAAAAGPIWSFPYFRTLPELIFLGLFLTLGICATVVLVSSRAMLARIAPQSMMAQFFGLFSLSGFATAFIGHGLVATATGTFQSQRAGLLSVILLLALGWFLMLWVREEPAPEI